ncbi:MAG TPA: hypothetical protein VFQ88_07750 [Nevskiaceae bacterium]|nr:hypothetical protein [Nevskiaceae bacterium]
MLSSLYDHPRVWSVPGTRRRVMTLEPYRASDGDISSARAVLGRLGIGLRVEPYSPWNPGNTVMLVLERGDGHTPPPCINLDTTDRRPPQWLCGGVGQDSLPSLPEPPATNADVDTNYGYREETKRVAWHVVNDSAVPIPARAWYMLFGVCKSHYLRAVVVLEHARPELRRAVLRHRRDADGLTFQTYASNWLAAALSGRDADWQKILDAIPQLFGCEPAPSLRLPRGYTIYC